ncbi:hypothetical protein [Leptothermofonsia sp. ETS-13]|uniref:hypothetical protein n=1 Tax=Leptothermofonsia sp. ETS-13 TaxID=3035696 RepID=UPI003BA2ECD1
MNRQQFAIGFTAISILSALASPLSAQTLERTVNMTVVKASTKWVDSFDQGIIQYFAPDFYVIPTIDGRQLPKSKVVSDKMEPTFNHSVATKVSLSKTKVPISLKLMDSDTFPNSDDIADINPLPGQDVLTLNYEPSTGSIYGPDGRKLGTKGQAIAVKGDKDKHGVEITFIVTHKDTTVTSPQLPQEPSCPVAGTNCQVK